MGQTWTVPSILVNSSIFELGSDPPKLKSSMPPVKKSLSNDVPRLVAGAGESPCGAGWVIHPSGRVPPSLHHKCGFSLHLFPH